MRDARPRFPFTRPRVPPPERWLGHLETAYATRWFSNHGPLVRRLERALADDVGPDREAVTCASATAGLVGALLALDVRGPVAVPAFTFPATAHAIQLAGCEPVLCDVDPERWELAPEAAAQAVEEHGCVAIVHVRAYGLCRDLGPLEAVARAAGVPLVVDAAAAYGGADPHGRPVGGAGVAEVFSFHATKAFAVGEGGAVLAEPELAARVRHVLNFALADGEVTGRGLNGKMSEHAAAVALAMREELADHLAARRAVVARLQAAVAAAGVPACAPPQPGAPPWQGLPLLLEDRAAREQAVAALARAGVEARRYYAPGLHRTRAFAARAARPLPVTDALADRVLCLPVYADLDDGERERFAAVVHAALETITEEATWRS